MRKFADCIEVVLTVVEPDRIFRLADECLLTLRHIESKQSNQNWVYEYEVRGDFSRIDKFFGRLREIETGSV
jgi:hypothetical protein